ncbi:MAG: NADPH-dependent FMN reductase [Hyphomicrobiaceae bacterium]
MTHPTSLLFISGSAREASLNKKLARLGAEIAKLNGVPATFADLGDYPMPLYDGDLETNEGPPDNARKLYALMSAHAGVFVAAPEYNAGITPLLKNSLDWMSRVRIENDVPLQVFKTRVFLLAAASPGGFGGLRGLIMLRQTLTLGLGALVLPEQFIMAKAHESFDEDGRIVDTVQLERLKELVQKLSRAAAALQGDSQDVR